MNSTKTNKRICHICGETFNRITEGHVNKHEISLTEYKLLFGLYNNVQKRCIYKNELTQYHCKLVVHLPTDDHYCILHNQTPKKDRELFNKIFQILLELNIKQNTDIHFEGIFFPIDIDLSGKSFEHNVYFSESSFNGEANFSNVKFHRHADFRKCVFKKDTSFDAAEFWYAHFGEANFKKTVSFSWASIEQIGFWKTSFNSECLFTSTTFKGRTRFTQTKFPTFPFCIKFINTRFENPEKVRFAVNDFSRVSFLYTDISSVRIENALWPITSRLKGARRYLADEFLLPNPINKPLSEYSREVNVHYNAVRILYQQLKRNYEERRNFNEAGNFYFGEMECYRKSNNFRRYFPFNLVNLYRLSSGYGQRYIRAGIVLILLLFIFAFSHLFSGLNPTPEKQHTYQTINHNLRNLAENIESIIPDFFKSTVYCLQVITRTSASDRLYQPASFGGEVLNIIFPLLIFLQAVFFALAVRRHFKR